jgi:transposase
MNRRAKVELFEEIRREYEHGVGTILGVARKLGIHRRMVREALGDAVPGLRKVPVRRRPKLSGCVEFIDAILEGDRKAPRKQRHTAHRIWCRLRAERPEVGAAESTIREYVRKRKKELGLLRAETFVPQSYRWGQEAQVDWYEAYADIDGQRQKVYVFCLRSMASGGGYHRAYPHETQQAFLEAHERAFEHFGGTFATLRYDNLGSAVRKVLRGHQREETQRFIAFRSHWGFRSEFCTVGQGHEKGGVEGENGFFRRNHLVPVPMVGNWAQLNALLEQGLRDDARRTLSGRTQSIGEAMGLERHYLQPLSKEGFDLAVIYFPKIDASRCAKVLTNFYSAPVAVGAEVQAKVHAAYVEIWQHGKRIARHERCFGRQQKVLELEHYLDVLINKPGAFAGSTPLAQCRAQGRWPASYDCYWEELKLRQGKQQGTRAMIEVLHLGREYGMAELRSAVESALNVGCFDVNAVRLLLNAARSEQRKAADPVEIGPLSRYDRPPPTLNHYDRLLGDQPNAVAL